MQQFLTKITTLNTLSPFDLQDSWDNSGLNIGDLEREVGDKLSLIVLERTKKNAVFIDTTLKLSDKDSSMEKMQQAIQIIEDFGKNYREWKTNTIR